MGLDLDCKSLLADNLFFEMTLSEKQRKMKIVCLIILVNCERYRKGAFKGIDGAISFACEQVFWARELRILAAHKPFEKGGLADR